MNLTHLNEKGQAHMVDVSDKAITSRSATAQAIVSMQAHTFELLATGGHKKGDVLAIARIAGIQAAKKCPDLIPLCHPIMLTKVTVDIELDHSNHSVIIFATCKIAAQTGVEMESLCAVNVAALTIYDMCKAVDKTMRIDQICVLEKSGGKSGDWKFDPNSSLPSDIK
ncbi:cyclic pyranopterin monophosphate synthase [Marinicellulosiphila megalodicopiae]